jgi:hypothetical protein
MLRNLLNKVDRGLGLPELVEGHDWGATEHGADALAIYRQDDQLHFRLWESKAVTGITVYPTTVVGEARDQLDKDAIGEVPAEFHIYVRTLLSLGLSLSIVIESTETPQLVITSAVDA